MSKKHRERKRLVFGRKQEKSVCLDHEMDTSVTENKMRKAPYSILWCSEQVLVPNQY